MADVKDRLLARRADLQGPRALPETRDWHTFALAICELLIDAAEPEPEPAPAPAPEPDTGAAAGTVPAEGVTT